MSRVNNRTVSRITVSGCEFNVISYKISHSENTARHFTVSGDTFNFRKGLNPVSLTVRAGCISSDNLIVPALESALVSASVHNFIIDRLCFSGMTLADYSVDKNINGIISSIIMTFVSLQSISPYEEVLE